MSGEQSTDRSTESAPETAPESGEQALELSPPAQRNIPAFDDLPVPPGNHWGMVNGRLVPVG